MYNGFEWRGHKLVVKKGAYRPAEPQVETITKQEPIPTPPVQQQPQPVKEEPIVKQTETPTYGQDNIPPPPMYNSMTLVGGPAANLPTHGHNQIFVNNVRNRSSPILFTDIYV